MIVENEKPWDLPEDIHVVTSYYYGYSWEQSDESLNPKSSEQYTQAQSFYVEDPDNTVDIVIDNCYEQSQLTIVKMNKQTGETLSGAVFSVYKIVDGEPVYEIVNGEQVDTVIRTYTTNSDGELVVRGGESYESEILYGIKETGAPEGYLLPQHPEWHYFYFCNDEVLEPDIKANLPEGATAVNLTNNGDRITVDNQKEMITIPVMKLWQGGSWPTEDTQVVVGLYRSVEGVEGEPVPVYYEDAPDTPRTVTLNSLAPYNNNTFTKLPSRDDVNRNYIYSIKEESINGQDPLEAGYVQEYGLSSAGVYIVRNKPATTLTVSKEW